MQKLNWFDLILWSPPLYYHPPLPIQIFSTTLFVALFLWLNGWSCHIWWVFYLIIVWIYRYQTWVPWYQKDFAVSFMQQGIKFTEVWHKCGFFASTLIGCLTHSLKGTQHTQESRDWHTPPDTSTMSLLLKNYSLVEVTFLLVRSSKIKIFPVQTQRMQISR